MKGPEPVISQIIDKLKHINQVCCRHASGDGSRVGGFQISLASPTLSLGSARQPRHLHPQHPCAEPVPPRPRSVPGWQGTCGRS